MIMIQMLVPLRHITPASSCSGSALYIFLQIVCPVCLDIYKGLEKLRKCNLRQQRAVHFTPTTFSSLDDIINVILHQVKSSLDELRNKFNINTNRQTAELTWNNELKYIQI